MTTTTHDWRKGQDPAALRRPTSDMLSVLDRRLAGYLLADPDLDLTDAEHAHLCSVHSSR